MAIKGIDVSAHNGKIDWKKVKEDGIAFAIIKFANIYDAQANEKDSKFESNYKDARAQGIKLGVYIYNYCNTVDTLKKGLKWAFEKLGNKKLDMPVYLDMEDKDIKGETVAALTKQCNEFAKFVEKQGYQAGVYANKDWLTTELNPADFDKKISVWVAQYNNECTYKEEYDIWQYSNDGKIEGISDRVDMNYLYNTKIIKESSSSSNNKSDKVIDTVKVTADAGLNCRKKATTNSDIVTAFAKGTSLKIYEVDGNWGRTSKGWVCLDYTDYRKSGSSNTSKKYTIGRYEVTCDVLTVREGSGTGYDWKKFSELTANAQKQVKEKCGYEANGLVKGVQCDVSKVKGNWGKIPSGWICLDYCKKI